MSENSNGITVTLKGGQGFEAPWIVIHATDATDALNQINDPKFADLTDRTVAAATFFRGQAAVKQSFPGAQTVDVQQGTIQPTAVAQAQGQWSQQGSQQAPPQFAQQQAAPAAQGASRPPTKWDLSGPPPGEPKRCIHGDMQWKHRVSKAGNEYKAWACTDRANPCDQQYVK